MPLCAPYHSPSYHSFFFNDTAPTEIYTLSLHDALPIYDASSAPSHSRRQDDTLVQANFLSRSEEHTSELQSRQYLVCRLLPEKKKRKAGCRLRHDRQSPGSTRVISPLPLAGVGPRRNRT